LAAEGTEITENQGSGVERLEPRAGVAVIPAGSAGIPGTGRDRPCAYADRSLADFLIPLVSVSTG